jgi:hypothetical protein
MHPCFLFKTNRDKDLKRKPLLLQHKMRSIAFILAIIVLALSFVPCADSSYSIKSGKVKAELTKGPSQDNDMGHKDACSPFCQCSCCAGFTINHIYKSTDGISILTEKKLFSHLPTDIADISLPIWQPPKLKS